MITMRPPQWLCVFLVLLSTVTLCSWLLAEDTGAHPDGFMPTLNNPEFYETPERSATISLDTRKPGRVLPATLFGVNTSYFNDTDEIWSRFHIPDKLKSAGVGALRYPGGEETSFYHWKHPGVNGYEDILDPPDKHGYAPDRGPFQVSWTPPEDWDTNEAFMSFDEFIAHCREIGAEPIVGLNLSSGRKHHRIQQGLQEALELMRYARDQGYQVRYWFLDNEPWHGEANYTFDIRNEYNQDVLLYGRAIKKEFPDAKLIINPFAASSIYSRDYTVEMIRATGEVVDYIDMHWYWAWGLSSWERWRDNPSMTSGTRWSRPGQDQPYVDDIAMLRSCMREAGYPDMGICVLEWNIGPGPETLPLSQNAIAMIHAQMLMEFATGGVDLACTWPNIWQSRREIWPEQDAFPSLLTQEAPFRPTRTSDLFRLFSQLADGRVIPADTNREDLRTMATLDHDNTLRLIVLSKSSLRRKLTITLSANAIESAAAQGFNLQRPETFESEVSAGDHDVAFFAEPYSFTLVTLNLR